MAHRGEHEVSRKATAQGMSDALRCPVCSCAHFSLPMRMRPRVQRASGIPCALWIERAGSFLAKLGRNASRERETISPVILRCERSEPRRMNRPQTGRRPSRRARARTSRESANALIRGGRSGGRLGCLKFKSEMHAAIPKQKRRPELGGVLIRSCRGR